MESVARIASKATAKIFVPVAKCFLGIVKRKQFYLQLPEGRGERYLNTIFDLYYTRMPEQVKTPPGQEEPRVVVHYDTRLPKLTLLQRALIPMIGWVVWAVIRLLGPTIRFEVLGGQKAGREYRPDLPPNIYAFWHRCIISAAWYFRNRGGVLMNTTNFDGQWTRRVIERLGYRHSAGKFDARRIARTCGHGAAA